MKLNKYFVSLAGVLLAASAHAQTQEAAKPQSGPQAHTSANSPAIGQAVSGHNTTAAGLNSKGQVTGKSTAVIGAAPGASDNVNAQATNTTSPNNKDPNPAASGGRGKAGTKAEQEIVKASKKKHAQAKQEGEQKEAEAGH